MAKKNNNIGLQQVCHHDFDEPDWKFGFLKVYNVFPWVSLDEEERERWLIDEVRWYWGPENDFTAPIYNDSRFQTCYINPDSIARLQDNSVFDLDMVEYFYCEITTKDGETFWLADIWERVFDERDEPVKETKNDK